MEDLRSAADKARHQMGRAPLPQDRQLLHIPSNPNQRVYSTPADPLGAAEELALRNDSGALTIQRLEKLLKLLNIKAPHSTVEQLLGSLDTDHSGDVDVLELDVALRRRRNFCWQPQALFNYVLKRKA